MSANSTKKPESQHHGRLRFLVPVDAASILPESLRKWSDRANYLLDLIRYQCEQRECDERGYARLKFLYLRRFIPPTVLTLIRDALVSEKVIDHDPYYLPEEFAGNGKGISMGYRFSPRHAGSALRWTPCVDDDFAQRVLESRADGIYHQIRLPIHKHLREWLKRVEIDVSSAKQTVINEPRLFDDRAIHHHAIDRLANINDPGNMTFCYSQYGRVFTSITNLPREVREHLHIAGEPLVTIDVTNCQPLMLCIYQSQANDKAARGREEGEGRGEKREPSTSASERDKLPKVAENTAVTIPATEALQICPTYRQLCERGQIYEHMMALTGETERRNIKRAAYYYLFGPATYRSPFADAFDRAFPETAMALRTMKRGGHERVARALQRVESNLMIHTACHRIMQSDPSIPILTVHDAILTTPAHASVVAATIRNAFAERGLSAPLKAA